MTHAGPLTLLLLLGLGAPSRAEPGTELRYTVTVTADLGAMHVRACGLQGFTRLIPGVPEAAAWARDLRIADGAPLARRESGADLPVDTACVTYTVDLARAAERGSTAAAVMASPGRWLWRPVPLPDPEAITATLTAELPPGVHLSVPWPQLAPGRWRLVWSAFRYRSNALIGRFDAVTLPVDGGVFEVAFLGRPVGDRARFERWLVGAARNVATVFGRSPVARAQIIVQFQPGAEVGFGATERGGGPGAILYVGDRTTATELTRDWTATHELFHLGMPRIEREDAWLSEGVTTVYTFLAMARGGQITARRAFAELRAGFARGRRRPTGRPLRLDSREMSRIGAWWRVYWAGGAWALDRAVHLARAGRSFDDVLRLWATAAGEPGPSRTAADLLAWADRALPGHEFSVSAAALLDATAFPATAPLLDALGITPDGLDARGATLRAALVPTPAD